MSGSLYEEPVRGHVGVEPVLILGADIAEATALVCNAKGEVRREYLNDVTWDWRYVEETRAWKTLEDLMDPVPQPDLGDPEPEEL